VRNCTRDEGGTFEVGNQVTASVAYGLLAFGLFEQIRQKFLTALKAHEALFPPRSE
jgi:hypothetical protein